MKATHVHLKDELVQNNWLQLADLPLSKYKQLLRFVLANRLTRSLNENPELMRTMRTVNEYQIINAVM